MSQAPSQPGFDQCRQSPVSITEVEQMSTSAPCSCGYVVPNSDSDLIGLHVLRLNGEGFMLKVSSCSLGCEVHRLVSKQFQPKKGEQLTLQYLGAQLMLHQTLQEQGIVGKEETLSCTSVPTDLLRSLLFHPEARISSPWGRVCSTGDHADRRCNCCTVWSSPTDSWNVVIWRALQPEPRRSEPAKQS